MLSSNASVPVASAPRTWQAPGARVHENGVPWMDASGKLLRVWLGTDEATFYDTQQVALMPSGLEVVIDEKQMADLLACLRGAPPDPP